VLASHQLLNTAGNSFLFNIPSTRNPASSMETLLQAICFFLEDQC
jgi:hypothetical protein